jgi:hypothetical protein
VLVKSFIIATDEAATRNGILSWVLVWFMDGTIWSSGSSPTFRVSDARELTESDLLSCKQNDKEPLQNYFRRFVHLRAQAQNVLDVVAINVAIVGLRTGQFRSHLIHACSWAGARCCQLSQLQPAARVWHQQFNKKPDRVS